MQSLLSKEVITIVENHEPTAYVGFISRTAFYEKAEHAYVAVSTSEEQPYGCVIMKKGVR
ncbi:MAG: RbsD/FucU domain-containing protein [Clostridia bacterium]